MFAERLRELAEDTRSTEIQSAFIVSNNMATHALYERDSAGVFFFEFFRHLYMDLAEYQRSIQTFPDEDEEDQVPGICTIIADFLDDVADKIEDGEEFSLTDRVEDLIRLRAQASGWQEIGQRYMSATQEGN